MTQTYPLKVVSRSLPATRSNKIRISWFIVGTAFGIGCTSALTPLVHMPSWGHTSSLAIVAPAVASVAPASTLAVKPAAAVAAKAPETPELESIVASEPAALPAAPAAASAQEESPAQPVTLTQPNGKSVQNIQPESTYPLSVSLKVKNGDTLLSMLTDAGAPSDEAYSALEAIKKIYEPKKLVVGQNLSVQLDKKPADATPVIASLILPLSATASLELNRAKDNSFNVKKVDAPVERKLARAGGEITSSLYETGVDNNIPVSLLSELIDAYSYDVDFQRDIKQGDSMDMLYERMETKDGVVAGHGNMIYAELDLGDRVLKVYRFIDASGQADYYNEKGESIRKALLRTPVNGAKVTSGYGMRNHPILGYSKMHRGIDFGAPLGTPIYAAGDGTVDFVGKRGGYGNYVRIKHNGTYSTAYAHISRFASGIEPGSHVKQGQIIAYVGATGMATGPHLHYEILVNNEQVNPANVKFKTGNVLGGKELTAFHHNIEKIEARLSTSPRNGDVAMLDTPAQQTIN